MSETTRIQNGKPPTVLGAMQTLRWLIATWRRQANHLKPRRQSTIGFDIVKSIISINAKRRA
jgi:hypothetical protein